jgi:toxin ParE1/3/4
VTRRIVRQPTSLLDLDLAANDLRRQSGPQRAVRFLREADATFQRRASAPGIGSPYSPDDPLFEGVRFFPISRYKKYLVFYRPIEDGIEILRVLHGARDIHGILAEGFDLSADEASDTLAEESDPS